MNHENPYAASQTEVFQAESARYSIAPDQEVKAKAAMKVMQIITAALMMGISMFVFVLLSTTPPVIRAGLGGWELVITAVVAVAAWTAWWIVRKQSYKLPSHSMQIVNGEITELEPMLAIIQRRHILSCAFLEGAAFFGCSQFIYTRNHVCLTVGFFFIGMMAYSFPRWKWLLHEIHRATAGQE
ncbi:MAG: hypothetical protein U0905_19260 [Pirellulales bacterium]